jgi:4-nitrophenyl phosphatase
MELKSAVRRIGVFLLDMDGTFYLGERLLPGALEFLDWLNENEKQYLFLTNNSSKERGQYAQKLSRLGAPVSEDRIFTSSEATALYLQTQEPGARLYVLGTPALQEEFSRRGFCLVEEDPDYAILGFDTTLTYERLWKFCDFVREGRPYIATHADLNCPTESGFMPDAGSFISLVAASTGRKPDLVVGKPERTIVEMLVRKTGVPVERMAMVGDRLYTDIAMGKAGLTTILVFSGETRPADLPGSPFQPNFTAADLGDLLGKMQ